MNIPPSGISAKRVKEQDIHKLTGGKNFIFNRGRRWEVDLTFQAHIGQADIDLLNEIVERDNIFHIWINDDSEDAMGQVISPYAFKDMLKVSAAHGDAPNYYKNLWISGVANKITMVEVD
jgi:hypothetical protein